MCQRRRILILLCMFREIRGLRNILILTKRTSRSV